MNLGIKNRTALVTGASRGLGSAIAHRLAEEGVRVVLVARSQKDLLHVFHEIGGEKQGHFFVTVDLTKETSPERTIKKVLRRYGNIDILINNLGDTLDIRDPYCSITDWRKLWRINMEVAIELTNLLIPDMEKRKWGRIVNITSIAALENQGPVPYCAIKAALTAYTRAMGRILSPDGIIMTAVLPGAVYTKGGYWDIKSQTDPEFVKKYIAERMAIKRLGKPDEIASMVAFLCSELASFCVGSMIPVDGGQGRVFFQS